MMSFERGFAGLLMAMVRLLRHHRKVERTLPLIDAYPPALGGRVGYFDQWLTHPDADDPYWSGLRAAPDLAGGARRRPFPPAWSAAGRTSAWTRPWSSTGGFATSGRRVRLLVGPWTHTSAVRQGLAGRFR